MQNARKAVRVNATALKERMDAAHVFEAALAEAAGIDVAAFRVKLRGDVQFSQKEIMDIARRLGLNRDACMTIFFSDNSAASGVAIGRSTRVVKPFEQR